MDERLDELACHAAMTLDQWRLKREPFDPEAVSQLSCWLLDSFPQGTDTILHPGLNALWLLPVADALKATYPGLELRQVRDVVERARQEACFLGELARRREHSPSAVRFCLALSRRAGTQRGWRAVHRLVG